MPFTPYIQLDDTFEDWRLTTNLLIDQFGAGGSSTSATADTIVLRDSVGDAYANTWHGALNGNASTATALETARTIEIIGDGTGSASFDGTGDIQINLQIGDANHTHTTANITDYTEATQDLIGNMVTSNTENGIAVTYDDTTGKLNFDVGDFQITLTGAVTGTGSVTNLGNVTINTSYGPGGNLTTSDLTVDGEFKTADNLILLNYENTGAGIAEGLGGMEIERGSLPNASIIFDETDDTWKVDPGTGTAVPLFYTDEQIQDIIGAMVTGNTETNINVTYDDGAGKLNFDVTASLDTEAVQDIVGAMVTGNTETNIDVTYDDAAGKLNFVVTGGGDVNNPLSDDVGLGFGTDVDGTIIYDSTDDSLIIRTNRDIPVKLQHNGSTKINTTSTGAQVTGDLTVTGTLNETSDRDKKENDVQLMGALDMVLQLVGKSFNMKETPDRREIGFIAQEVFEVVPEVVGTAEDGSKTLAYARITALLVEAMKEQQAEIEALKAQIQV